MARDRSSQKSKRRKVVAVGGGTGTFAVLSGLKKHPLDIAAVVSMADSGGSARKERDEWGLLPVSDVRKALLALSEEDPQRGHQLLRELMNYRFSQGVGVEGMTFGNLFLVALSNILGSQEAAIEELGRFLDVEGRVIPVTLDQTNLVAEYDEGVTVVGEHEIDEPSHDGRLDIRKVYLLPEAEVHPQAAGAIRSADLIVIGPGDLYTSLLPPLLVKGTVEALRESKAIKVYVLNLMNRYGQTYGFTASRFLSVLEEYGGGLKFDYVLFNTAPLPEDVLRHYAAKEKSFPVEDDLPLRQASLGNGPQVVRGDFLSDRVVKPQKGDKLRRSLLRHDSKKLARTIMQILKHTD